MRWPILQQRFGGFQRCFVGVSGALPGVHQIRAAARSSGLMQVSRGPRFRPIGPPPRSTRLPFPWEEAGGRRTRRAATERIASMGHLLSEGGTTLSPHPEPRPITAQGTAQAATRIGILVVLVATVVAATSRSA